MEPSSGSTRRCASGCESAWEGTLIQVRPLSTRSRPRLPVWAANGGDTTAEKKVRGRRCHLLVDTEGLVLKAKVHSAISPQPGWLEVASGLSTHSGVAPVKHLWLDAGFEGRDKQWVEEVLGLPGCRDRPPRPPKPIP